MNLRVIIIILSLLAILATALGGHFSYQSLLDSTLAEAHREAEEESRTVSEHIDLVIAENQRSVMALAGHDELSEALTRKDTDSIIKANRILDLFHRSLDVSVCYLMDSKGSTIASSNRNDPASFVDKNYSFRPYFQESMGGIASVYMALGVTSNKRGLYVGYPVYGTDKENPVGVAVIKKSATRISDALARSYDGIMLVTNPHGLIFISSNKRVLYKFLWQVSEDAIKEITDSKQFGKGPWDMTGIVSIDHDHDDEGGEANEHAHDSAGIEYQVHEKDINRYSGWKVVYLHEHKLAAQKISAPIFESTKSVIIALLLITALFILMLYKKASSEISARKQLENRLRSISITDELTGIYNRRGFFELARHEYHTAARNKNLMSLFYLDIDDMKHINDKYGHKEGDNALTDVAAILKATFRKSDIMARLGGDEFAVLMVRSADYKSENIANRIENVINEHNSTGKRPFKLSVSIGEVTYDPEKQMEFDDFLNMADGLMYEQKKKKETAQ